MTEKPHNKLDLIRQLKQDELERLHRSADPFPRRTPDAPVTGYERAVLLDEIFERLSQGESLQLICDDAHMPSRATVMGWLSQDVELGRRYDALAPARARAYFELALWEVQRARDRETMQIAERRALLYLRAAALLDPKVYSDKTHTQLGKQGGNAPLHITLNIGGEQQQQQRGELTVIPQPESGELP